MDVDQDTLEVDQETQTIRKSGERFHRPRLRRHPHFKSARPPQPRRGMEPTMVRPHAVRFSVTHFPSRAAVSVAMRHTSSWCARIAVLIVAPTRASSVLASLQTPYLKLSSLFRVLAVCTSERSLSPCVPFVFINVCFHLTSQAIVYRTQPFDHREKPTAMPRPIGHLLVDLRRYPQQLSDDDVDYPVLRRLRVGPICGMYVCL